jgi:hypothetical protein
MTGEERKPSAKSARKTQRSRIEHGFPERIEDPAAVAMLATLLHDIPAPRPSSENTDNEGTYNISYECG